MTIAACPPNTPAPRGVVVFVPADFKTAFPRFSTVDNGLLTGNFTLAELQLNNSCGSRVKNAAQRETLLNLLVAHITQLLNGIDGLPPAGIVGQVNSAQEGSVQVGATVGAMAYGQAYYMQTQYGAIFWASTARYRTALYVPAPITCADLAGRGPFGPYGPGYNGGGCGC